MINNIIQNITYNLTHVIEHLIIDYNNFQHLIDNKIIIYNEEYKSISITLKNIKKLTIKIEEIEGLDCELINLYNLNIRKLINLQYLNCRDNKNGIFL